jgi:hypothetical protein
MTYLVDTDILIDATRNNPGAVDYLDNVVSRALNSSWALTKNQREVAETVHITELVERRTNSIQRRYTKTHGIGTLDPLSSRGCD